MLQRTYTTTCPYCGLKILLNTKGESYEPFIKEDVYDEYYVLTGICPNCNGLIVILEHYAKVNNSIVDEPHLVEPLEIIYPKHSSGRFFEDGIPDKYISNFREAEQVLSISPKASATISRYLLQLILHEELGIKKRNLEDEINELESQQIVSAKLVKMLQVFRKVANFGAHPKKSANSTEIVEVAHGEADIMLDLLEELFDCVFIKPKQQQDFLTEIEKKYGITE